ERVEIEKLAGALNGGRVQASGGLAYKGGVHDVDVKIEARGVSLDFPEGLQTLSHTDLRLHSVEDDLVRLDGTVTIEDGSYRERLDVGSEALTFLNGSDAFDFVEEPDP